MLFGIRGLGDHMLTCRFQGDSTLTGFRQGTDSQNRRTVRFPSSHHLHGFLRPWPVRSFHENTINRFADFSESDRQDLGGNIPMVPLMGHPPAIA